MLSNAFLRGNKVEVFSVNFVLLLSLLCLALLLLLDVFFCLLAEEILTCHHLIVLLAQLLLGREGCVGSLLLGCDFLLLSFHILLFKVRQEAVPVLTGQLGVLSQLTLYHQLLNVVNWVNVLHGVEHNSAYSLECLEVAHSGDGIALDENVTLSKQLECLQGHTIRPNEPLPALHKAFLVSDEAPDLDNIAEHVVVL